ncbi:MAG: insulinase family protein, partial [Magnetococcales bacterium]|nr:insulinase family protein [Magnetococcales bacterium]
CCSSLAAADLDYREVTLENGLRVILLREDRAPVVVVQVWYHVGSVDEVEGKTGLAHMLEHMMFQGTKKLAPEEFARIVARNGGVDNAATSHDFTYYYIKLGSDRLELALSLEADRMRDLLLRPEKFKSENQVVREERRMRNESTPAARMAEAFQAAAYRVHPYGRPVIGWMEDIQKFTVTDLVAFYQKYYAPNNATLIIAGDFAFATAEALVRQHFAPLPRNPDLQRPRPPVEPPPDAVRLLYVLDAETRVPVWRAGFLVPTLGSSPAGRDAHALALAGNVLGGGSASRLYRRLVTQEKLAVSVQVDYADLERDPCLLTIHVTPAKGASLARLEAVVGEEVTRLQREPVPDRELTRTQNAMIAEHTYNRDSIHALAAHIGQAVTSGVDWKEVLIHYPERIRAVTAADIQKVAERHLSPQRWVVGVLLPIPTPKPKKMPL